MWYGSDCAYPSTGWKAYDANGVGTLNRLVIIFWFENVGPVKIKSQFPIYKERVSVV